MSGYVWGWGDGRGVFSEDRLICRGGGGGGGCCPKQHDAFAYCIQWFLCCIYLVSSSFLSYANTFSASFSPLTFQRFVTFDVFTEAFDFWLLKRWLYGVVMFSFKNISVGGNVSLLTHLKVSSLKPYSKVRVDKHLSWLFVSF